MREAKKNRNAPPDTPSNAGTNSSKDIAAALPALLADLFALHVTTKNCHWHISGQYFRDYHLLLDEQAAQILAMTDDIAEGARKIGGTTIRSIGRSEEHTSELQSLMRISYAVFCLKKKMNLHDH